MYSGRPHVTSERQTPDTALDPRCQSGPSASNSFDPKEGRFSKDYGADQQRLQISDLHFDKFPDPATFVEQIVNVPTPQAVGEIGERVQQCTTEQIVNVPTQQAVGESGYENCVLTEQQHER